MKRWSHLLYAWHRVAERWTLPALAAVVTLALGWAVRQDDHDSAALAQEAEALSQRLAALSPPQNLPAMPATAWREQGPAASDAAAVWAQLQQGLQAWGLQVLMLQPQTLASKEKPSEHTVLLHVQGAWARWRAFERAMAEHAPWWSVQHLLVLPAGAGGPEVRLELQARVAWRDPVLPKTGPWSGLMPQTPNADPSSNATAATTTTATGSAPATPAQPSAHSLAIFGTGGRSRGSHASNPPAARIDAASAAAAQADARWVGTWQQGGQTHAVFTSEAGPVALRAGQRLPQQDGRLRSVSHGTLEVQAAPGPGLVQRWHLETPP